MAEERGKRPKRYGSVTPKQPRPGVIIGIIFIIFVVIVVVGFFLVRGMQERGAVQDVEDEAAPPAEQQSAIPGGGSARGAIPLFPATTDVPADLGGRRN